jgi:hypothetical protein
MMLVIKNSAEFYHCEYITFEEISACNITVDFARSGVFIGCQARHHHAAQAPLMT